MNYYVVVEGAATEREVYRSWIPLVNKEVTYVTHPSFLDNLKFTIMSGFGYPFYKQVILRAIEDITVMEGNTRLVVCVDSEDMEKEEKFEEIQSIISSAAAPLLDFRIVVQHFCFEAWALGNRKLKGSSSNSDLIMLRRLYDVSRLDPEGLPPLVVKKFNRSQHAAYYLSKLLNNKNKSITYSKSSPSIVAHPKYFEQVKNRLYDTQHINSFDSFLNAFQ
jgi:hypothetical protein